MSTKTKKEEKVAKTEKKTNKCETAKEEFVKSKFITKGKPQCKTAKEKDVVSVDVTIDELQDLVEFALNARFMLITLLPTPKKGSRAEKILKNFDNAGPALRDIATRLGLKFNECKCNDEPKSCKCDSNKDKKTTAKPKAKK